MFKYNKSKIKAALEEERRLVFVGTMKPIRGCT
jgi:hypothetical protein